jgi:hypothetical protein
VEIVSFDATSSQVYADASKTRPQSDMQAAVGSSVVEFDEPLDVFGQNSRLSRLYTQLCFCFPLSDLSPEPLSAIISLLNTGLETLSASFPWTAGQVIHEAGIFKIVPLEKIPSLIIKDLRDELPTMDEFREDGFPFKMLDEELISPRNTFPERFEEPAPVFILQANFIIGGLLLVFSGQHNCMDMAGQGQIINLFAKATRGEAFTDDELRTGNLSRRDIIPLLKESEINTEPRKKDVLPSSTKKEEAPAPIPQSTWAYFLFSALSLSHLKTLAMKTVSSSYVSTDDVLSAFLWQSVTRARLPRFDSNTSKSTFDRQVDVRKHLDIPLTYTGNVVFKTSNTVPIQTVLEEPLGIIASYLRSSLSSPSDIAYKIRLEATMLNDRLDASVGGGKDSSAPPRSTLPFTDIKMSSWAKEKCYELDFGSNLGKAEAVRRPRFEAWEGLAYLLPKRLDREIAVAVCLGEEDLERLRSDAEFAKFGKYIG